MMDHPRFIPGDFSDYKTLQSRSVFRIYVDFPIEHQLQILNELGAPSSSSPIPILTGRNVGQTEVNYEITSSIDGSAGNDIPVNAQGEGGGGEAHAVPLIDAATTADFDVPDYRV